MRQRAMIAMALSLNPDLLIADEPTTAPRRDRPGADPRLDRLKQEFNAAIVIVTHDLGVVAEHCDHIQVMYAGKIVEAGDRRDIYYNAQMPYTWGLLSSIPRLTNGERERLNPIRGLPPSLIFVPEGCASIRGAPTCSIGAARRFPSSCPPTVITPPLPSPLADKERIFREEIMAKA